MTSYVKFTPLTGAKNKDPLCYLLEIDEAKILLDAGWYIIHHPIQQASSL